MSNTKEREALADWKDARVQVVYNLLCETEGPPNPEEHWEGWIARRIIAALASRPPEQAAQPSSLVGAEVTPSQLYEAIAAEFSDDGVPWSRQKGDLRRAYRTYASIINMWNRRAARGTRPEETATQAEQAAQVPEPLSEEEIDRLYCRSFAVWQADADAVRFARAIERAHGIGVQLTKEGERG